MRQWWDETVSIETAQLGKSQAVGSTQEAHRRLVEEWPVSDGDAYEEAKRVCVAALQGRATVTEAQAAFIDAAREADIYLGIVAYPGKRVARRS